MPCSAQTAFRLGKILPLFLSRILNLRRNWCGTASSCLPSTLGCALLPPSQARPWFIASLDVALVDEQGIVEELRQAYARALGQCTACRCQLSEGEGTPEGANGAPGAPVWGFRSPAGGVARHLALRGADADLCRTELSPYLSAS